MPIISSESPMARYQGRLDAEAFEQIVSRFLASRLAAAQQILSDSTLAEDAVQKTFLRIVRKREQYLASIPFSKWFYAILRNVCKDMLRHRARETKIMQEVTMRSATRAQPSSLDSADVLELLAKLPEEARAVLTLRIMHDLPFRDVAAALRISEEAAKKRAQRDLRRLRKHSSILQLL